MLKFPKDLISETFENNSGLTIYKDKCKLIYRKIEDFESEKDKNSQYFKIEEIDRDNLTINLQFTEKYVDYVLQYFNNEPKEIMLADIGSWNPYAEPTSGQFLMLCHIDKIIKFKCLIEGKKPLRIFCVNNETIRLFNEIQKIQNNTTVQKHPKFLTVFIKNPDLTFEYKVNLLCNYYIKKFKEMGSRVGIYWNYWIYQSTCKNILEKEDLEGIKILKEHLVKGINRDGDPVLQVNYKGKTVVIYNEKKETMCYVGNDLINMIRLYQEFKVDKVYLCVAVDHKYYQNTINLLSSFLNDIGIKHTKYILIFHPKVGYYDSEKNLHLFSKSKGNLGDGERFSFLGNLTWINHFSYFFNTQKETFALNPEQQHGLVLNKTRALLALLDKTPDTKISDIAPFIYCLDKLHKAYQFNQMNLFEEIFRNGIKTENKNVIYLINSVYNVLNK